MLNVSGETVCRLVELAQAFQARDTVVMPEDAGNPIDDAAGAEALTEPEVCLLVVLVVREVRLPAALAAPVVLAERAVLAAPVVLAERAVLAAMQEVTHEFLQHETALSRFACQSSRGLGRDWAGRLRRL